MAQTLIAYLIVALAAAWTFRTLAPRAWRRWRKTPRDLPKAGCGDDCGCGD